MKSDWVWTRALPLDPARALDHCLKREFCSGRGQSGEGFPLGLYSYYFVDIFSINSSKKQQNTQIWRSRWLICGSVAGLYYVQDIVTWSFCFFLCILLNSPSLHVHRRWENCRESCTKLSFLSFLLKSHVTVGQKLFSLLEVRGRWNGWWISKENYIYLFFCMQAACVCGGVGKEAPHYTIYIGSVVERAWFPPGYRFISHVKWVWIPLWRGFILPFLPNRWLLGEMLAVGTHGALCLFISLFLFYLFLFSLPFSGTVGAGWRCF